MSLSLPAVRFSLIGLLCLAAPGLARADGQDDGAAQPAAAAPAAATTEDEVLAQAKAHFQAGRDAFDARDYQTAVGEFRKAEQLKPSPLLDYNIGLCLEALGKPKKAIKAYQTYLEQSPAAENRAEVEARIAGLSRQVATQAAVEPPPAEPVGGQGNAANPNQPGEQRQVLGPQQRSYKTTRRWGLFGAGAGIFGGLYLINVIGGAASYATGGNSYELFIPLVGPLIYAANYNANPLNGSCTYDYNGNPVDCTSGVSGYLTAAMVLRRQNAGS